MPNNFETAQVIVDRAALELYNTLGLGKKVYQYGSNEYFDKGSGMPGPTINVPMPIRYLAKDGPEIQEQNIQESTKPVTINQDKHVGLSMSVFDMTLNTKDDITHMASKYIKPAVQTLADAVDDYLSGLAAKLYNTCGTAAATPGSGTAAATMQLFADSSAHMMRNGVSDRMEKLLILNPAAVGYVPAALSALFVREAQEAVRTGRVGYIGDYSIFGSANIRRHTAGTVAGTPLTNGAGQIGSTIAIDGLNAGDQYLAGDIVTFGASATGPCTVHPVNKRSFATLQEFVVTADVTADGTGAVNLSISPAIVIEGAYQNVSIAVADGLTVTKKATHVKNMAIIKDTLCLASVKLKEPMSAVVKASASYQGLNLLLTAGYDVKLRKETARLDILFGGREMYPETGVVWLG